MTFIRNIGEFETVSEAGPILLGAGSDILIDVGFDGQYFANTDFGNQILVDGAAGAMNLRLRELANVNVDVFAASFGNLRWHFGTDSSGGVSAFAPVGGVGNIFAAFSGGRTSGGMTVRASGDVGNITLRNTNVSGGNAGVDVETSGNIGNIRMNVLGGATEGSVSGRAFGGNIGDVRARWIGGSASGTALVSAFAVIDAQGNSVGGNIGDIALHVQGGSADASVGARADGGISAGVWKGGGEIGDIRVVSIGGAADNVSADVTVRAFSGGTIGNIDVLLREVGGRRVSACVAASAWGGGGKVASIGNIDAQAFVPATEGAELEIDAFARDGGNIGNVTARLTGANSFSSNVDVDLRAEAASGGGGNIGDITLSNASWKAENFNLTVYADTSVGRISAYVGGGDGQLFLNAAGNATFGDILVTAHLRNVDPTAVSMSFSNLTAQAEIGNIILAGGSIKSAALINQAGGGLFKSVASVNGTEWNGTMRVNLANVDDGTTILASKGGADIRGTEGSDTITLGQGADIVRLNSAGLPTSLADDVLSFTVTGPTLDKLDLDFSAFAANLVSAGTPSLVTPNGTLLRVVQPVGGDVTTEAGMSALGDAFASANLITLGAAMKATVIAATGENATTWYVYEVQEADDLDGAWDTVRLLAEVQASHGIASLTADNFL